MSTNAPEQELSVQALDELLLKESVFREEHLLKLKALKKRRDVAFEKDETRKRIEKLDHAGRNALAQMIGPEGVANLAKLGIDLLGTKAAKVEEAAKPEDEKTKPNE